MVDPCRNGGDAGDVGDQFDDPDLERMVGLEVRLRWPAGCDAGCEHPCMLAGAAVKDRSRVASATLLPQGGGAHGERPRRGCVQRSLVEPCCPEDGANGGEMHRPAAVAGTNDREVLGWDLEPGFNSDRRLEGFDR